jgi:hypothetical protein
LARWAQHLQWSRLSHWRLLAGGLLLMVQQLLRQWLHWKLQLEQWC